MQVTRDAASLLQEAGLKASLESRLGRPAAQGKRTALSPISIISLLVAHQTASAQRAIHCTAHGPDLAPYYTSDSIEIRQVAAGYETTELLMNRKDAPRTRKATPIFETHDRQEVVLYIAEPEEGLGRLVSVITVDFRAVRVERYEPTMRLGLGFMPGASYQYTGCIRLD